MVPCSFIKESVWPFGGTSNTSICSYFERPNFVRDFLTALVRNILLTNTQFSVLLNAAQEKMSGINFRIAAGRGLKLQP